MARKKSHTPDELRAAMETADDELSSAFGDLHLDGNQPSDLGASGDVPAWVAARGWTPVEFLVHTYRNGHQRMEHRIAAAKAVLEYAHRKIPQKVEAEVTGAGLSIDASMLKDLSDKDLDLLEKLLVKAVK
jgi:hypothetical protein